MIHIVADTLASLSPKVTHDLNIPVIPQLIIFGNETFRDDTECCTETLLQRMRSYPGVATTSAPPPHMFQSIYEELGKNGDTILVLAPSSQVSGTFTSATTARQDFPNLDIHIFDSRTAAGPLGVMVLEAHRLAQEKADIQTILAHLNDLSQRSRVFFILDTLDYLYKGGRIGSVAAIAGSLLRIKPILTVQDGQVVVFEKLFTEHKAVMRIFELVNQYCPCSPDAHLTVMQCGAEDRANELAAKLSAVTGIDVVPVTGVSSALVVHGGPGILAVSFFIA